MVIGSRSRSPAADQVLVHVAGDPPSPGDLILSDRGAPFIVEHLLDTGDVVARPERWHERARAWLRECVGRDRNALPFAHVVVGERFKINPGPGHGGEVGDMIRLRCGRWRWRDFRIVQILPDGCALVRRPRWYDRLAAFALGVSRAATRRSARG